MNIISLGAEAILYHAGDRIIKERHAKSYRIEQIDTVLRKTRTRREAKVLEKLAAVHIPAPRLLALDDRAMKIEMTFLDGSKVRDVIGENTTDIAMQIGKLIASLHAHEIIHGDLTTSNLIVVGGQVHVIDFGLSFFSQKVEDMAVDLNVLHRTIEATHHALLETVWTNVICAYSSAMSNAHAVIARLDKVQGRGRNKTK